jgi:hypothetical protein
MISKVRGTNIRWPLLPILMILIPFADTLMPAFVVLSRFNTGYICEKHLRVWRLLFCTTFENLLQILLSISSLNKTQERTKSSTGEITVRHYLTETVTAYREEISDHTDVAEINDCHKTLDIHNSSRATTWNPPSITGIGTALRITPLSLKKVSLW